MLCRRSETGKLDLSEEEMLANEEPLSAWQIFPFLSLGWKLTQQSNLKKVAEIFHSRLVAAGVTWGDPALMLEVSGKSPRWVSWAFYTFLEHSRALFHELACWDENPNKWYRLKCSRVLQQPDDSGNKCFLFFSGWWCIELKRPGEKQSTGLKIFFLAGVSHWHEPGSYRSWRWKRQFPSEIPVWIARETTGIGECPDCLELKSFTGQFAEKARDPVRNGRR